MTNDNLPPNGGNGNPVPVVFERDGRVFANSRDVADCFGKRHDNVLRDVRNVLGETAGWGLLNFEETPYVDPQNGQTYKTFSMTKNGFTYLVQGYTGPKAAAFKIAYIDRFDTMESALKSRSPALPDLSDPVVLVQLLTEHASKRIEAEKRADAAERAVEAAKPKTEFYDHFANADGLYGLQNAGRVLKQGPNKFISFLKRGYMFYQGGELLPKAQYRDAGLFEVKSTLVDDKARLRSYITPRGLQYFAKKLGVVIDGDLFRENPPANSNDKKPDADSGVA